MLQADEFVVTWLPRASCPEIRAEIPDAITCSTLVEPIRRIFLSFVRGTTFSAIVVHAADPGAEDRPRTPVDLFRVVGRSREAGILPGLDRRQARIAVVSCFIARSFVLTEGLLGEGIDAFRRTRDGCSRTSLRSSTPGS